MTHPDDPLYLHADGGESPWEGTEWALLVLGGVVLAVGAVVSIAVEGWG